MQDIARLETQVVELRKKMTEVMPRRPIVIEFCGSPRSGKTQSLNSLSVFLRRNNFRVHTIVEQASINPIPNKFDPAFNVWNGCNSLCKLLEAMASRVVENDFILLDRGIFDTVCWFYFQMQRNTMPASEYDAFTNFFFNEKWLSLITLVYVFNARPTISLEREYATLLTRKAGSVMRDEILQEYNFAVQSCVEEYGHLFSRVERLDTSDKDQDRVGYIVTSQVLNILDDVLQERIGFFENVPLPTESTPTLPCATITHRLPDLQFERRVLVEANLSAAQPIAIAVIRDRHRNSILIGTKSRKTLKSRSPELNRTLFWFGGHVRQDDAFIRGQEAKRPLIETLRETARREIKEELDLDVAILTDPDICIWDQSTESGRKHIAFVFVIELDLQSIRVQVDNKEYSTNDVRELTLEEYTKTANMKVDAWSHAILLDLLKWHTGPLFEQTELNFLR